METKFKIIETDSYILAVSDEEIKDENWVITDLLSIYPSLIVKVKEEEGILWTMNDDKLDVLPDRDRKIIAHKPKGNAPELDLPLIPEMVVEDDVEKLAYECFENLKLTNPKGGIKEFIRLAVHFGYNKGKASSKIYSEDDLRKAMKDIVEWVVLKKPNDFVNVNDKINEIIQSLKQSKTPVWFEAEIVKDCDCFATTFEGCSQCLDYKTTTNSEGKQVLVGTYLYE